MGHCEEVGVDAWASASAGYRDHDWTVVMALGYRVRLLLMSRFVVSFVMV